MQTTFRIKWHYEGGCIVDILKPLLQAEFVKVYNDYCTLFNNNIERWNSDFDGDLDSPEYEYSYNKYIAKKAEGILVTAENKSKHAMDYFVNYENGQYLGIAAKFFGTKIYFTL